MSPLESQVKDCCPVRLLDSGRQAIAALPGHVDLSTAGPVREQLLAVINRGAETLIADMSATVSCDHAGADTLARVYQRAAASGTELRLVVTAPVIRRVLGISGLDRLVSIYPVLEAALAAHMPAVVRPLVSRRATAVTPAVVRQVLDALPDGIALTDATGEIRLVNRRLEEMFGYQHGELPGRSLQILVSASFEMLRGASDADWTRHPAPLPASGAARLTGARKDGTAFPVQISLRPVPAGAGRFTLAVIREGADAPQREKPVAIPGRDPAAPPAPQQLEETLNRIANSLFEVGIVLSTTADMPPGDLSERIDEAVRLLDDIVSGIYDAALRGCGLAPDTARTARALHQADSAVTAVSRRASRRAAR